jgi:hypothetical protein
MGLSAQALSELVDKSIMAYRSRDFKNAIASLQEVLDSDPRHWRAKLYMAMSYFHSGEVFTAYRHFAFLKDNCADAEIRGKAEAAMSAMNSQVQASARMPQMTCTIKKPTNLSVDCDSDDEEVEWVKQS